MEKVDVFQGSQPYNQIWYTSIDKEVIKPILHVGGPKVINNTYVDDKGIITFDRDLTEVGVTFSSNKLLSISFPDCSSFKSNLFFSAENLCRIKFKESDGRNLICDNVLIAVANEDLDTYEIPEGLTVKGFVFLGKKDKLRVIKIGKGTHLKEQALEGLTNVKRIYGEYATANGKAWIENGILIAFACGDIIHYDIPEGVTKLGRRVFACSHLKSVRIPESVSEVGWHAFGNLKNIRMQGPNVSNCENAQYLVVNGKLLLYSDKHEHDRWERVRFIIPESVKSFVCDEVKWGSYVFQENLRDLQIILDHELSRELSWENFSSMSDYKLERFNIFDLDLPKLWLTFLGGIPEHFNIHGLDEYYRSFTHIKQKIEELYNEWKDEVQGYGIHMEGYHYHPLEDNIHPLEDNIRTLEDNIKDNFLMGFTPDDFNFTLIKIIIPKELSKNISYSVVRLLKKYGGLIKIVLIDDFKETLKHYGLRQSKKLPRTFGNYAFWPYNTQWSKEFARKNGYEDAFPVSTLMLNRNGWYSKNSSYTSYVGVRRNGFFGVCDREGNEILPCEYEDLDNVYLNSAICVLMMKKDGKWGCHWICPQFEDLPCIFDRIYIESRFFDSIICEKDGKIGIMNCCDHQWTVPVEYDSFRSTTGRDQTYCPIIVEKNGKFGIITTYRQGVILPVEYDKVYRENHVYYAEKDGEKIVLSREEYPDIY